ncbi:MAG: hypothetical protein ACRC5T_03900 [Cetobacterium sp.]
MLIEFQKEFVQLNEQGILKKITGEFIKLKDLDGVEHSPVFFEISGKDLLKVFFKIEVQQFFKILVEGVEYLLIENVEKPDSEIGVKNEMEMELSKYEPLKCNVYKTKIRNSVLIIEPEEVVCDIIIEMYSNENFPDEPLDVIEFFDIDIVNGFNQTLPKRGYIYVVKLLIDNQEVHSSTLTTRPLNYYSNYNSIVNDLMELNLFPKNVEEEYVKGLIAAKSTLLKMRFGLTEEQSKDIELMPVFKSVVNLYCIKDMIPLGYVSGELSSSGEGVTASSNELKLGNLSVGGGPNGGSGSAPQSSSILSTESIQDLIKVEEEKLIASLFKAAKTIKKQESQKKLGGVKRCLI